MKIFDSTEKNQKAKSRSVFDYDYPIEKNDWLQVFSACLGKIMAIQTACSEIVVKHRNWNVDFTKGLISFGNDEYPLQFIGSEASSDNTWLWGWENINGFSEKLLSAANMTRQIGEQWELEPLITAGFDLTEQLNGHNLSIVTCGISKEQLCYYRGPHDEGAIFVAFSGAADEVFSPIDQIRFTDLTMQCIQQFTLNHKIFIESLLIWNQTKYDWEQNRIIAHFEQDLSIDFEEAGGVTRLCSMKTRLQA